ncbi:GLPGLI family protein [Filimonas zeae]|uniref:GLPGLI family protein n=1 Tax=Filimonas zeae TaxID=1737353 RepID=A0A917N057_9BACT|nr:GLPGLI family protein [Filimonas zeae]MDR6342181.1 GLPGLI family protein [Filimonas zeae]GGH78792.1 hypothetical protein GCM10011379_47180 [Filimonas zeae]
MKLIIALLLCLFLTQAFSQQGTYVTAGRIEFEKKVNSHALLAGEEDNDWYSLMKKTMPQFRITYYNLLFRNDSTLYMPGRENLNNGNSGFMTTADENIVFSDLSRSQYVAAKLIFDEKFLIKDSTRQIKWKITSETRNIAGFDCRRANALIMDSIYVVAFYTDMIIPPGGPEGFNGLPGMIMGVALPHEHVSWFATKVFAEEVKTTDFKIPAKGKAVTNKTLFDQLQGRLGDWGKWAKRNIVAAML